MMFNTYIVYRYFWYPVIHYIYVRSTCMLNAHNTCQIIALICRLDLSTCLQQFSSHYQVDCRHSVCWHGRYSCPLYYFSISFDSLLIADRIPTLPDFDRSDSGQDNATLLMDYCKHIKVRGFFIFVEFLGTVNPRIHISTYLRKGLTGWYWWYS